MTNNNHTIRYVLLLFPLYRCENWDIGKLRNIPKITQLGNGRTQIQVFALKGLHSSEVRPASLHSIFSPCPGAHNPPLPTGLGRLERGERAILWRETGTENLAPFVCTFHWASRAFWYFWSWKSWHTSFILFYLKIFKSFKFFIGVLEHKNLYSSMNLCIYIYIYELLTRVCIWNYHLGQDIEYSSFLEGSLVPLSVNTIQS